MTLSHRLVSLPRLAGAAAVAASFACSGPGEPSSTAESPLLHLPPGAHHACGPGGALVTSIAELWAGPVEGASTVVVGEPIQFHWRLYDPLAPAPSTGRSASGLTLDGAPVEAFALAEDPTTAIGGLTSSTVADATPTTHTLALSGPCGTTTQTITVAPLAPTAPDFALAIDPGTIHPGATSRVSWNISGHDYFHPSDCARFDQRLRWYLSSNHQYLGEYQGLPLGGGYDTSPTDSVDFVLTTSCEDFPSVTRTRSVHLEVVPVAPPPPAPPRIDSFAATNGGYVTRGSSVTFDWSASAPRCSTTAVSLVGADVLSQKPIFSQAGLSTVGSLTATPLIESYFTLTVTCIDTGASAKSNRIHVSFPPSQPDAGAPGETCFKVTGTNDGTCLTEEVPLAEGDAKKAIAATYPSYGGWMVSEIPCANVATACPIF